METRYSDRSIYFKEQAQTTSKYVIPFIDPYLKVQKGMRVLEIGCGEGGNLLPYLELGCTCVGIDLNAPQIERSKEYLAQYVKTGQYQAIANDIYLINNGKADSIDLGKFDLIIMRDVIEHIHGQDRFMKHLKNFLAPNSKIFFGFPPWYMPFGGHQQVSKGKAAKLPYIHLLPNFLYFHIIRWSGNPQSTVDDLAEIKETGISIERFRKIVQKNGYQLDVEQLWLINPNYEIKFGLKPRKQWFIFKILPFLRNFITTCNYSIISLPS